MRPRPPRPAVGGCGVAVVGAGDVVVGEAPGAVAAAAVSPIRVAPTTVASEGAASPVATLRSARVSDWDCAAAFAARPRSPAER